MILFFHFSHKTVVCCECEVLLLVSDRALKGGVLRVLTSDFRNRISKLSMLLLLKEKNFQCSELNYFSYHSFSPKNNVVLICFLLVSLTCLNLSPYPRYRQTLLTIYRNRLFMKILYLYKNIVKKLIRRQENIAKSNKLFCFLYL